MDGRGRVNQLEWCLMCLGVFMCLSVSTAAVVFNQDQVIGEQMTDYIEYH